MVKSPIIVVPRKPAVSRQTVLRRRRPQSGFTLIEVAVVIAIIAALLGTLLVPLATQVEAAKIRTTDLDMGEVREALIGFAMANGRLPCPDTNNDGLEEVTILDGAVAGCNAPQPLDAGQPANSYSGTLPFSTLGVGASDAWGRLYLYQVTQEFVFTAVAGSLPAAGILDLQDDGSLQVITRGDNPATVDVIETRFGLLVANLVPAVVVSLGANGIGGTTQAGNVITDPDATINDEVRDERTNRDGDGNFVSRTRTIEGANCDDKEGESGDARPACAFDDRVIWLSANLLFNRLVTASVLP